MKKFFSFVVDILFVTTFFLFTLLIGLVIIYYRTYDLAVLNEIIQNNLAQAAIGIYAILNVCLLIYFVIIPFFLHATIGEFAFKLTYAPKEKVNILSVFMRNIVGFVWNILLFPYTIYAFFFKKQAFKPWLSGYSLESEEKFQKPRLGFPLLGIFSIIFFGILAFGIYLYQTSPIAFIEPYIDHKKQVEGYIKQSAYSNAAVSLQKFKQYKGESSDYFYYNCIIESHIKEEDPNSITACDQALEKNSGNQERTITILANKANLLRVNYKPAESLKIYDELWTKYNVRSFDMVNYVYLLDSQEKRDQASTVLGELYKEFKNKQELDVIQQTYFAELYYNLEKYQEALEIYTGLIQDSQKYNIAPMQLGEIYYKQGQCYYHIKKNTEAKAAFTKVKELNPDYTDQADAYIIEIDFRSKLKK